MGYSAENIEAHDDITIRDADRFWDALTATAADPVNYFHGQNRFSWTDPVDRYRRDNDTKAEAAAQLLLHYGFDLIETDGGTLTLGTWGSDKIGMSWDVIWDVIAAHAEPYSWVMRGEDGTIWRETNPDGERKTESGTITFKADDGVM